MSSTSTSNHRKSISTISLPPIRSRRLSTKNSDPIDYKIDKETNQYSQKDPSQKDSRKSSLERKESYSSVYYILHKYRVNNILDYVSPNRNKRHKYYLTSPEYLGNPPMIFEKE